jgi:hypothetical protein
LQGCGSPDPAAPDHAEEAWIVRSNSYTNLLLDVQLQHSPEQGSREGVAKFDERISNPTLAHELAERFMTLSWRRDATARSDA